MSIKSFILLNRKQLLEIPTLNYPEEDVKNIDDVSISSQIRHGSVGQVIQKIIFNYCDNNCLYLQKYLQRSSVEYSKNIALTVQYMVQNIWERIVAIGWKSKTNHRSFFAKNIQKLNFSSEHGGLWRSLPR